MRINKDKSIGRVLFIVEGGKNEFNILKQIFCKIFSYSYIEHRRNGLEKFINPNNKNSTVAVINTFESNINAITDHEDYLDEIFNVLREKYRFPVDQSAIYYLFDRDPESNTDTDRIKEYIRTLKDPYDNGELKGGQFLLSYPSIESYVISGFMNEVYRAKIKYGVNAKAYVREHKEIQLNKFSDSAILHATEEFIMFLENQNVEWDIDRFEKTSMEIFNIQEANFRQENTYRILSMLTLAFLQLGMISL